MNIGSTILELCEGDCNLGTGRNLGRVKSYTCEEQIPDTTAGNFVVFSCCWSLSTTSPNLKSSSLRRPAGPFGVGAGAFGAAGGCAVCATHPEMSRRRAGAEPPVASRPPAPSASM